MEDIKKLYNLFMTNEHTEDELQQLTKILKECDITYIQNDINIFNTFVNLYVMKHIKHKKTLSTSNKLSNIEIQDEDVISLANYYIVDTFNQVSKLNFDNKQSLIKYIYQYLMFKINKNILKEYNLKYKKVDKYTTDDGLEHTYVLISNTLQIDEDFDMAGDFNTIKEYNKKVIRKQIILFLSNLNDYDKFIFNNLLNKYYYGGNSYTREELIQIFSKKKIQVTIKKLRIREEKLKNDFKSILEENLI